MGFSTESGVVQEWNKAGALQVGRFCKARQFTYGRIDINQFRQSGNATALWAGRIFTWDGYDQRRMHRGFKARVLVPHAMISELPAMVAAENDHGVIGKSRFLQRFRQATNLLVDKADAGVVSVNEFACLIGRKAAFGGNGCIATKFC